MVDPTIIVAIISGVMSIIAATLTSWLTAQRVMAQMEVKVDLLWKTYIVDAIKSSRESGLVASNSPEAPTDKWEKEMPGELRNSIESTIRSISKHISSPYDITIETVKSIGLEAIARKTKLSPKEVVGVIYIITERILDEL